MTRTDHSSSLTRPDDRAALSLQALGATLSVLVRGRSGADRGSASARACSAAIAAKRSRRQATVRREPTQDTRLETPTVRLSSSLPPAPTRARTGPVHVLQTINDPP